MIKTINFFYFLLFGLLIQSNAQDPILQNQKEKYLILRLTNIDDNTILYLYKNDIKIDSTVVYNGKGELKIKSVKPEDVYISNDSRNNFQFKLFWIEPSQVSIVGDYRKLKKAKVIGSKSNDLSEKFVRIDTAFRSLDRNLNPKSKKEAAKQYKQEFSDLIRKNRNSFVALFWLAWECKGDFLSKKEIAKLYNILSEELKNENTALSIKEYLELRAIPKIGDQFVDFEQNTADNKKIKLSKYLGKITLLEFWGSWCRPCRKENPLLLELYYKYHPKGFEILGVSLETDNVKWGKAIREDKLPWENVSDLKGGFNEAAIIYGINSVPNNLLINSEGKIIYKNLRSNNLEKVLEKLFQ